MLALDGPAPLAKLLTQRARRRSEIRKEAATMTPGGIDRVGFTPGAPLMIQVQNALQYYICQRLQDNSTWRGLQVELSGATVKGEGETKMLRRMLGTHAAGGGSHLLASSDSDMLLMALMSTAATSDIFVLSEHTAPRSGTLTRCFSLKALDRLWLKQHGHLKHPDQSDDQHLRGLKADLCLLAIVIRGNDYMPGTRCPFTITMQGAWRRYLALRSTEKWRGRSIIQTDRGNQIDGAALGAVLRSLGNIRMSRRSDDFQLLPEAQPAEYLEGLQWVVDMYSTGECDDYRWAYDRVAPTMLQLAETAEQAASTTPAAQEPPQAPAWESTQPLRPAACAMALLPPVIGPPYAPEALRHLMQPGSPISSLYELCDECESLGSQASKVNAAGIRKRLQLRSFQESRERAQAIEDESAGQQLDENIERLQAEIGQLSTQARQIQVVRTQHQKDQHPYQPFPIALLEETVDKVPASAYSEQEKCLLDFGVSQLYRYKAVSRRQPGSSYVPSPPGSQFRQLRSPLGVFWQDIAETPVSFPASSSSSADLEASTTSSSSSSGDDTSSLGSTADIAAEGAAHAEAATAGNRSSVSVASQDQHGEHGDRWPFRRTHVDPGSTASHLSYGKLLSAYKHRWEQSATGSRQCSTWSAISHPQSLSRQLSLPASQWHSQQQSRPMAVKHEALRPQQRSLHHNPYAGLPHRQALRNASLRLASVLRTHMRLV